MSDFKPEIKAIPTEFGGIRFRSRLEAKWAAFFDLVGWRWEYEPVDFNGWIPDFAIVEDGRVAYVEVKPVYKFPDDTADKIEASGCGERVLIVGAGNPMRTPWGCGPGWLGEIHYGARRWNLATYGLWDDPIRIDFCGYDPLRCGAGEAPDMDLVITAHWRTAANETQWGRSTNGLWHIGNWGKR